MQLQDAELVSDGASRRLFQKNVQLNLSFVEPGPDRMRAFTSWLGKDDEVIVPDVTFIATANAVTLTGATVVLVDVEPDRLTIDPQAIEAAITARTKAIVPVHLSGRSAAMDAILQIAKDCVGKLV